MDLTKTEFQVCAYTASGYEPKETASILFRSYHTIIAHKRAAMEKYNARNVAELTMRFVLENGDPRKFIAIVFLTMHIGIIYNENRRSRKVVKRDRLSKRMNTKHSKTREYYI